VWATRGLFPFWNSVVLLTENGFQPALVSVCGETDFLEGQKRPSNIAGPRSAKSQNLKPMRSALKAVSNEPLTAEPAALVLETRCAVGEGNSPLLQAPDEFGRDARITELLRRLPYLPATDFPVGTGRSV
jgi:hypothetical protein